MLFTRAFSPLKALPIKIEEKELPIKREVKELPIRREEKEPLISFGEIKPYLKRTFTTLSAERLSDTCSGFPYKRWGAFYPTANDICFNKTFVQDFLKLCETKEESKLEISPIPKLGFIVGAGYVLSLAPEIPADDILLCDVEPAVHFYTITIRNAILETKEGEDFKTTQTRIRHVINTLDSSFMERHKIKYGLIKETGLPTEEEQLGPMHFLASKERFAICLAALKRKNIIPITINIFDRYAMETLGLLIKDARAEVSFMNFTNLLDYHINDPVNNTTNTFALRKNIEKLPLTPMCKFIFTHIYESYHVAPSKCFTAHGIEGLRETFAGAASFLTKGKDIDYRKQSDEPIRKKPEPVAAPITTAAPPLASFSVTSTKVSRGTCLAASDETLNSKSRCVIL